MNQHSSTSTRRGFVRLGPQARRAYQQLYQCIVAGLLPPGTKLLSQQELARALGVSLLTLRQALAQLEQDGLIASHHGRGTFVQAPVPPSVLILEDEPVQQEVLAAHVQAHGCRVLRASRPADGVVALQHHPAIALILCDVRLPTTADGIWFIRTAQRLWPAVPLAVVTAYPEVRIEDALCRDRKHSLPLFGGSKRPESGQSRRRTLPRFLNGRRNVPRFAFIEGEVPSG